MKKWSERDIPRAKPTPETLAARERIVQALERGPMFRCELMDALKIDNESRMSFYLDSLCKVGRIEVIGTASGVGRKGIAGQSKLFAMPGTQVSKTSETGNRATSREPAEFKPLRRDPFAAMRLAEGTRR